MFDFYRFLMKQLGMYAPWSLKGATDNFHFYMTFIFNLNFVEMLNMFVYVFVKWKFFMWCNGDKVIFLT